MTDPAPRLIATSAPSAPEGLVLLLHGGRERGHGAANGHQLAALRMIPTARRVSRSGGDRLAVFRLINSLRGWNGAEQSPVADALWAIGEMRGRYPGDLPLCVVGHSMGGRTAMRVGGAPGVRAVVGMAPWLPAGEPVTQLSGRDVLIIHGSTDRTTSPRESAAFTRALAPIAARSTYVDVQGEKHALMRARGLVDGLVAGYAAATLLGTAVESGSAQVPNLLRRALAGEQWLVA